MPLRDDLLNPIAGDNPGGVYLYYDPLYDKIKEARREDLDVAVGDYARDQKVADWNLVIKLAGDALANKSKDLQLAVWLVEAHLRKEGFSGLRDGLHFLRELISNFWDHLYPAVEEGDLELRATPIEWMGAYLDKPPFPVKTIPLTKSGHGWLKFQESRKIAYEGEGGEAKQEARRTAIAEGKLTPEEFDSAFNKTSKAFYVEREEETNACLEALDALNEICQEKFQDFAPGFGPLRTALEEVRVAIRQLLSKKRETEPDITTDSGTVEEVVEQGQAETYAAAGAAAAPATARRRAVAGLEPADVDEAGARIAAVAKFLRAQDAYGPAAYLLLRGWRWGELRAGGESPAATLLEAPPSDVRQNIKRLALESNWQEVLEAAETAMAMPCGRAWLDLQRYTVKACTELGYYYEPIVKAIKSELRALLADYPGMTDWTLMDDTPTANGETRTWLNDEVLSGAAAPSTPSIESYATSAMRQESATGEAQAPSAFELAMNEARSGRKKEAIEILSREVAQERSGRARFQRKLQLAQVCLVVGYDGIAQSILEELAAEIDRRKLEEWEAADLVAHPLALLYRSMGKADGSAELRQKLYAQICRLDPMQALAVSK